MTQDITDNSCQTARAATSDAAWDLLITNGLLLEFLGATDMGVAEHVSKDSHPIGLTTLRARALVKFPGDRVVRVDGCHVARTHRLNDPEALRCIRGRYSALRVLDASMLRSLYAGKRYVRGDRLALRTLICVLAERPDSLPHLRELRVPEKYAAVERHLICREFPRLIVTPAIDSSIERLMEVAYACGVKDNYPWDISASPTAAATPDGYLTFQWDETCSVKLLDVGIHTRAIPNFTACIRTASGELFVTWRDCGQPGPSEESMIAAFPDEFYEAFGDVDPDEFYAYDTDMFINFYQSCVETLKEDGRRWFRRAPFEMMLTFAADDNYNYNKIAFNLQDMQDYERELKVRFRHSEE